MANPLIIKQSYSADFQFQSQFRLVLYEILERGKVRGITIEGRALALQMRASEMCDLTVSLSSGIREMIDFQARYVGFKETDLVTIHPNHYDKLNRHISDTNQKLREIINALIPASGNSDSPTIDWEQRFRQLQGEMSRLEFSNEAEVKVLESNHHRRIAKLEKKARDLAIPPVPDGTSGILAYQFADEQEERVKSVKSTVFEIWKRLQLFDRTMKFEEIKKIVPYPEPGRTFEDYSKETCTTEYPSQWENASLEIQKNCKQLVRIKQDIAEFFEKHNDLLSVEQKFVLNKSIKKRKFPVSDDENSTYVLFSYQGKKETFLF